MQMARASAAALSCWATAATSLVYQFANRLDARVYFIRINRDIVTTRQATNNIEAAFVLRSPNHGQEERQVVDNNWNLNPHCDFKFHLLMMVEKR